MPTFIPIYERVKRSFEAYALSSAGIVEAKTSYAPASIARRRRLVAKRVVLGGGRHLLEDLMVVDEVPAWTSNRLERLARSSKR